MKTQSLILLLFISLVSAELPAQYSDEPEFDTAENTEIPNLTFNRSAFGLQSSLYPVYYRTHSVRRDLLWVDQNDSAVVDFVEIRGDSVLAVLTELSGFPWEEDQLELNLVRFYPSVGNYDPLVIPVGGMKQSGLTEAAPTGSRMQFNIIYQLARRNLAQADKTDDPFVGAVGQHPLMQPTPFRRDNLALLLALVTSQRILGLDSTFAAYHSAFWTQRTPERKVMEENMLGEWILSSERPLARWIMDEPRGSRLVAMTRAPRRNSNSGPTRPASYVEGLPLKGQLGFSVKIESRGLLVDKIDPTRLAFANGLEEGDIIREIDGNRVRTHKAMVEKILAGLENGGATLTIIRNDLTETLVLQPIMIFDQDYPELWDPYDPFSDSLIVPADSTSDPETQDSL